MTVDVVKVWLAQAVIRIAELARAACRFVTRRHITGTTEIVHDYDGSPVWCKTHQSFTCPRITKDPK